MQLFRGPMDGADVEGSNVGNNVFQRGIGWKNVKFADGISTAPVWTWCDDDPEKRVTYERAKDGKFYHTKTEKYK